MGGVVTHEVCYTGVTGCLKERCAVPHILGSLGGQNQASVHSPTPPARPRCTPAAPVSPNHLVLGLPLLHQILLVLPDSVLSAILWIFRVWDSLRKHVLSASTQDHLGPEVRAGGFGAGPWLYLYKLLTLHQVCGMACPHLYLLHGYLPPFWQTHRDSARPQTVGCLGLGHVFHHLFPAPPLAPHVTTHVSVHVVDQLCGDVLAALPLGLGRHLSIRIPVSVHRVRVGPGWGGVLHCGGGHHSH